MSIGVKFKSVVFTLVQKYINIVIPGVSDSLTWMNFNLVRFYKQISVIFAALSQAKPFFGQIGVNLFSL
jgi:hypothetical protein